MRCSKHVAVETGQVAINSPLGEIEMQERRVEENGWHFRNNFEWRQALHHVQSANHQSICRCICKVGDYPVPLRNAYFNVT